MRSAIWLAVVLAATLVAAACTATESPADDRPPGVVVTDAPPVEPVEIGDPLWTDRGSGLFTDYEGAWQLTLHEDTALAVGPAPGGVDQRLAAISLPDGQVRWQVDSGTALPGSAGLFLAGDPVDQAVPEISASGAEWTVLVAYSTVAGSPEPHGIAALSGQDGTVRWSAPLPGSAADDRVFAVDATDDVVVAARASFASRNTPPTRGGNPGTVVAFDAADGTEQWRREGLAPVGIAGDVLVGNIRTTAVGVDLATGVDRWEQPDSPPYLVSGELVLVGRPYAELVDTRTGVDVPEAALRAPPGVCAADDDTMIACLHSGGSRDWLVTYPLARGRVESAELRDAPPAVTAVVGDRIFLAAGPDPVRAYDGAATRLDEEWPAAPVAYSERYVAFRTDGLSVHRLG